MPTASAFLAKAASQIGYREGWNGSYWNNDTKFGVWYGLNYQPWCAIFVSWCANEVGALGTLVPKYASCSAGLSWFRQRGQTGVWPPRQGDIFILREYAPSRWNADSDGWAPIHTGIVESWQGDLSSGYIVTVEGNTNTGGSSQGNGVYRLRRYDSKDGKNLIYCRPKWDAEPARPSRDDTRTSLVNIANIPVGLTAPITLSGLKVGRRGSQVARYQAALWNRLPGTERRAFVAKYGLKRTDLYNGVYSNITGAMTARLYELIKLPPYETEPGPKMMRHLGFTSVR